MTLNRDEVIQPVHEICPTQVEVPTLVIKPPRDCNPNPTLCVQWFGEADACSLPEGSQFNFPLVASHDKPEFDGQPENFRAVFLGQVKNWPRPEAALAVADTVTKGNLDEYVTLITNHRIVTRHSRGPGPATYAIPIVLLADPNCGVIMPQTYENMGVLDEESRKVDELFR